MRATRIFLTTGEAATVEAGDDRCWASEEVSDVEVDVEDGTTCDVCGCEIKEPADAE